MSTLEKYQYDNLVVLKRRTAFAQITEEIYQDAFSFREHEHQQACFTLVDHCDYQEKLGNKSFNHTPNTILWRPPEFSHADGMAESNGRSFSVYIKDDLLSRFSDYAKVPDEFSEKNSNLVFLANRLRHEFRNWAEGSDLIAEGLVLEMLGYAAKKAIPASKSPPKWIARVVEKLEDEFLENHSSPALAAEVGIHPVHLARTFRKYHGRSVGTYLKEKRVHYSMQLIMQDNLTLAEIAYSSGFSDQSQFTRAFKEITGITPGAFRNEVATTDEYRHP